MREREGRSRKEGEEEEEEGERGKEGKKEFLLYSNRIITDTNPPIHAVKLDLSTVRESVRR